jgi:DNA-3-methyladenine glycosylase I
VSICPWAVASPEYRRYHDDEWGVPVVDDVAILEKLCLEGFQSGLSWLTILRKRDAFRRAFRGFDPKAVAAFGGRDVERLLADASIVRHRGKIEAAIANARAVREMHAGGESLAALLWSYEPAAGPAGPGGHKQGPAGHEQGPRSRRRRAPRTLADIPASTAESTALSRELRRRGFRFVGPTTAYAAMQSLGLVNDHLAGCPARSRVDALRAALVRP